jgi:ribosome-binding factor A
VSQRKHRVEHGLRDVLTEMIAREVKDPRVRAATLITVTRVELNVDLSVATVYISIVGDDATADGVLAGLAKAAGFLRGPVGRRLNLQHAPELRFLQDPSIDMTEKLAAIIRDDEERARAAGREIAAPAAPPPPVVPVMPPPVAPVVPAMPPPVVPAPALALDDKKEPA